MQKTCLVVAVLAITAPSALAATLAITFTNRSGDSITQLSATARVPAAGPNILTGPIANGAKGQATITSAGDTCVFTLTFTFASGKTINRPDTDICQTDAIIIE